MATPPPVAYYPPPSPAQPGPFAGCGKVAGLGCLLLLVGAVGLSVVGALFALNTSHPQQEAQEARFNRVPYETTREWVIAPRGVGKTIAFKPPASGLDEQTLRDLGATLRADTASKEDVHFMIFSDARAARLQVKWADMKTTKAETALCDRSYVGLYDRRPTGRYEKLDCVLDGVSGKRFFVLDYNSKP